jgi:hypothetical protein
MNVNPKVGWKSVVIGLLILVGLFYWFKVRPGQMWADCYKSTRGSGSAYQACLDQHGIKDRQPR